jgi:glycosyltransferase involved in cell wall biosynthesis
MSQRKDPVNQSFFEEARVPLVTIGLPVYNGARYLEGAVRSLLGQTQQDFALLISDNCSTDGTREMCKRLAAEDSRVRYARQETHRGAARNFATVLRMARSPFFMWAAHDDLWAPEFLSETSTLLTEHPDAIGAMTAIEFIDHNDNPLWRMTMPRALSDRNALVRARSVQGGGWEVIYGLYRREVLTDVRLEQTFGGDIAFVFALALRGRFVTSERVLRARRMVGYDEILSQRGRVVATKELGPEGALYNKSPHGMSRHMLGAISSSPLTLSQKVDLGRYVLHTYWWTGIRNRALRDSHVRVRHAVEERRYTMAALLALRHALLRPGRALSEVRRVLGGR